MKSGVRSGAGEQVEETADLPLLCAGRELVRKLGALVVFKPRGPAMRLPPAHDLHGLPSLSDQRRMSVLDGSDLSSTFFAVSIPAEGTSFGSSNPICTRTEA